MLYPGRAGSQGRRRATELTDTLLELACRSDAHRERQGEGWTYVMGEAQRLRARRDALQRSWSAFMSGEAVSSVRDEVVSSWRRTSRLLSPQIAAAPRARLELDQAPLRKATQLLASELAGTVVEADLVVALADARSQIVWTAGEPRLLKAAEQVNFAPGSLWDEPSIGMNAMSAALMFRRPSVVWSAEHWAPSLHYWFCCAAPIRHPQTGGQLGVLNFSTPWNKAHPLMLTTVTLLAERLGTEIAASSGDLADVGELALNVLGGHDVIVSGTPRRLTRRQTEIVLLLAMHPEGVSLEELHADLYGDCAVGIGTLKAEVCHLRRILDGRITYAPYRISGSVTVDALQILTDLKAGRTAQAVARFNGPPLPWSESPAIVRLSRTIEVALRDAVLAGGDHESAFILATHLADDVELAEHVLRILPPGDGRRHLVRGHLAGIA